MSEKINDGGPAFPCEQGHTPEGAWNQTFEPGMSLRDWFAGQAMAGLLSNAKYDDTAPRIAGAAYTIADAMLKVRGE